MPISSGFGHYPYGYPTTITNRVKQPQIVTNFPKVKYSFHLFFIALERYYV
jgi:hypothetical protein